MNSVTAQSCYTVPMARQEKSPEGFQRVTVDMPKDVYEELRRVSYETRDSMNKVMVSIARNHLRDYANEAKADIPTPPTTGSE